MFYVKYLKKPINIIFSLLVFILGVLSIVFCFSSDLFACEWVKGANSSNISNLRFFDVYTGGETKFTLQGIIEFANRFSSNQFDPTVIKHFTITDEMVKGAMSLQTISIVLIVLYAIFAVCQLFDFRMYSNFALTLTSFILMCSMKNIAFNSLSVANFINLTTNMYDTVKTLLCISFIVSGLQILYNLFVKFFAKAEI